MAELKKAQDKPWNSQQAYTLFHARRDMVAILARLGRRHQWKPGSSVLGGQRRAAGDYFTEVVRALKGYTSPYKLHATDHTKRGNVVGRHGYTHAGGPARPLTHTYAQWEYTMDEDGRVISVKNKGGPVTKATISAGGEACGTPDLSYFLRSIGKAGDDAGHLRAACLGGDHELINFIPQNSDNNQQIQCSIEVLARNLLKSGECALNFEIFVEYASEAVGPSSPVTETGSLARPRPDHHYRPSSIRYMVTTPDEATMRSLRPGLARPVQVCATAGWFATTGDRAEEQYGQAVLNIRYPNP